MKHGTKEMLKQILSNQELMMKALKIETAVKKAKTDSPKKSPVKKAATPAPAAKGKKPAIKK
ncbi:MAG: hypothetical protein V4506_16345 [Bacteroidota bacterium]